MPSRLARISARILCLLLPALLCGCIAYRPRLLSYEAASTPTGEPTASVTVMGEGVRVQAKAGDTWQVLKTGDKIFVGSLLMTDSGSEAVVELPGGHGQVNVAHGSVIEIARLTGSEGAMLVLSSGRVSGSVTGAPIAIVSSCGGSLSLTPNDGATVPFQFSHARDAQYLAVMKSLGLQADWAIFKPSAGASAGFSLANIFVAPIPFTAGVVPEPTLWALALTGFVALGGFIRRRR